jgi:hypothetical protein
VIARGFERIGKAGEYAYAFVRNKRGFSVHQLRCSHNIAAIDLSDALVAETHAKDRNASSEGRDYLVGKASVFGATRAGADEHTVGGEFFDLLNGERVASANERIGAKLAQVLDEVEDERVVVIENKDAGSHRRRTLSAETGRA